MRRVCPFSLRRAERSVSSPPWRRYSLKPLASSSALLRRTALQVEKRSLGESPSAPPAGYPRQEIALPIRGEFSGG